MPAATLATSIKAIRLYTSTEWELFVEEWLRGLKKRYEDVKRLGGSGDLGRDVVAFTNEKRLEGIWDNYQCKHYEKPLPASIAGPEIAKLIYFTYLGRFKTPRRLYFIAPRDVSTELSDLLNSPTKMRAYIEHHWEFYSHTIVEDQSITLSGSLAAYIAGFDFSIFSYYQTSEMLDDHRATVHWAERFGGLLPPPPPATVPPEIQPAESIYLGQLLEVYGERTASKFDACAELSAHPALVDDLKGQRERFFQAEAFNHHYRDETPSGTVEQFVEDIFDAIDPITKVHHPNGYERLNRCLAQAANVQAGGILAPHARPRTKQGVCHQLANVRRVIWVP